MNALVLYVGTQAIAYIQSKSGAPSISTITHSSHMDIFQNLAVDLDTEGMAYEFGCSEIFPPIANVTLSKIILPV